MNISPTKCFIRLIILLRCMQSAWALIKNVSSANERKKREKELKEGGTTSNRDSRESSMERGQVQWCMEHTCGRYLLQCKHLMPSSPWPWGWRIGSLPSRDVTPTRPLRAFNFNFFTLHLPLSNSLRPALIRGRTQEIMS